jgi:hypothetical protein
MVAPIALYPDPLVSQILVASTCPLELVQANQWLQRNPGLAGPNLTQAAEQQNWDPSVQALVVFPDVMKRLNEDVTWTTNLGNAFLAQQGDVMDAIQRMRQRAQEAGKLTTTQQQRVVQTTDAGRPVIEIVPADPPDSPGGAFDYVVKGNMIGGFALVAFPAEYGGVRHQDLHRESSGRSLREGPRRQHRRACRTDDEVQSGQDLKPVEKE